jgi:rare lipoprotein A
MPSSRLTARLIVTIAALLALNTAPGATPASAESRVFSGKASFYGRHYHGRVASGARYDPDKFTAAHRTLPFGTKVRVRDKRTGRSVVVTINDRGPFIRSRVLDLSLAAAKALGMTGRGVAAVTAHVE